MKISLVILMGAGLLIAGCSGSTEPEQKNERKLIERYADFPAYDGVKLYQLYRSEGSSDRKIRLATFDSTAGKKYSPGFNQAHCEKAAKSMEASDTYGNRYWCEEHTLTRIDSD